MGMPDDDSGDWVPEFEERWTSGPWPRVSWRPVEFCFGCEDWHEGPECVPGSAVEVLRELAVVERVARTVVPPFHDRGRASRVTFGWCSDHELAVTWWPREQYL
jgi:hypothetical protein